MKITPLLFQFLDHNNITIVKRSINNLLCDLYVMGGAEVGNVEGVKYTKNATFVTFIFLDFLGIRGAGGVTTLWLY